MTLGTHNSEKELCAERDEPKMQGTYPLTIVQITISKTKERMRKKKKETNCLPWREEMMW